ncbi:MAG: helix-turn-helix transcriptional regulator [Ruminococcaceae bacterium]|nr:helix-turn-helix transcriptional regulator [Oscillospiraceae bacterium]
MNTKYESEYRQLGLKIAYYRKLRGITQEQLAEKIDKSAAFIGHVEAPNVDKAISLDTLFDISEALDVPAHKFLIFEE